jgi:Ca2+-transporting ATPase
VQATTPAGLSTAEARRRRAADGPNEIHVRGRRGLGSKVRGQLADPLVIVLLVAAALTLITGDTADTIVIMVVVVVNTAAGVIQEIRADRAVEALGHLSAPTARVVRDGVDSVIPAADVVVGDLIVLGAGDIVPADAELVEAHALQVDESALTGESVPVEMAGRATVRAGTVVTRGRGYAEVTGTGARSALGQIATVLETAGGGRTPLQRRLAQLGRALATVAVAVCAVVFALGVARGESLELMIVTAISLVVAAVPESLPIVATLALAMGARRMARHSALVRRLPAVETLGSVTVLATDKTGTLTTGRMSVEQLWVPNASSAPSVRDGAYGDQELSLIHAGVLCNDADLVRDADRADGWTRVGDPTETALLELAEERGVVRAELTTRFPRLAEIPFDSSRRRMTTAHRDGESLLVIVKGAAEVVLERLRDDPPGLVARARAVAADLERSGSRVLVVATRTVAALPADLSAVETDLRLVGVFAIADPPRADARLWIDACREAGIRVLVLTGDSPRTASAIAGRVGLAHGPAETAVGAELAASGTVDIDRLRVVARVSAEQKLDIVRALQRRGDIVAMTGDGVNDGPALRQADIGVAMGIRGTEVAKQAADLVLLDDQLSTLVVAVEEGRRVYSNVRRFLRYGLSGGIAELLLMMSGPLVGLPLPLLPAQILWINMLTHGLPGVALGAEPGEPGTLRRKPRSPTEGVLGGHLTRQVLILGGWLAAICVVVGVWAHGAGRPWQSMIFVLLGLLQLGVALGMRSQAGHFTRSANPSLLVAVAIAAILQVVAVYWSPLQTLLSTDPLALPDLALVGVAGSLGYLAVVASRRLWSVDDSAASPRRHTT